MSNFITYFFYLIRQALIASLLMIAILAFYNKMSPHPIFNAIGLTSIASSIFIIFTTPHIITGHSKSIIGGYLISMAVGVGCYYLQQALVSHYLGQVQQASPILVLKYLPLVMGGLTMLLSLITMTIAKMPHPPAAGLSLGIIIDAWQPQGLIIIACIAIILVLIKHLLKFKPLINC